MRTLVHRTKHVVQGTGGNDPILTQEVLACPGLCTRSSLSLPRKNITPPIIPLLQTVDCENRTLPFQLESGDPSLSQANNQIVRSLERFHQYVDSVIVPNV